MEAAERAAPRAGAATRDGGVTSALIAFGHLAVLAAFALAQPLFNLLSKNPEFFAARGSTAGEIIVLALLLVLVPPAILLAVELLVGLVSDAARQAVHLAFVGLLAAVVFVQALKKAIDAGDAVLILLALALGAAAAALYWRAEPARSFLSVLIPAPLVFLLLFLFFSDVSDIVTAGEAKAKSAGGVDRVPIVMVLFDELPSTSLMDAGGSVDARRYPAFASLARDSTWFRNANSVYDSTSRAVPAIMDGDLPVKDRRLPTAAEHPNSIFALLGKSHSMHVSEEATTVCPRDLCKDERLDEPFVTRLRSMADDLSLVYAHVVAPPGIENDLATVSESWGEFGGGEGGGGEAADTAPAAEANDDDKGGGKAQTLGNLRAGREARFEDWVAGVEGGGRRPALNFKHALLPHVPWLYLPDGRQYRREEPEPIPQISRQSYKDEGQVQQLQLRHLLQTGFADRELGKLLARLRRVGIYDDALIVVAADHGVSFKAGQFDRRDVNRRNIDEITPVPLFIKRPGQKRGGVDRTVVETIDIVPTIADLLGARLPAKTDGSSAFSRRVRGRREVRMLKRNLDGFIRLSVDELERERDGELRKKVALFGTGADGPDRIYRVGRNAELVGRPARSAGDSASRASVVDAGELRRVDLRSDVMPNWITGRVRGGGGAPNDIAIAVNGTIRGVGNTFRLATGGAELFGVMIPPSALHQGRNRVEVFEVSGGRLLRMGGV
jgi:Sulfatase